ncbi:MAG: DUF433 domain-containing protein [Maricaulaceae bacterium]
MSQKEFPNIVSYPHICGGKPTIKGTRMRSSDVVDLLKSGLSHQDILSDYPYLTADALRDVERQQKIHTQNWPSQALPSGWLSGASSD